MPLDDFRGKYKQKYLQERVTLVMGYVRELAGVVKLSLEQMMGWDTFGTACNDGDSYTVNIPNLTKKHLKPSE